MASRVRISEAFHTDEGGFAFLTSIQSVEVTNVDAHHAHSPIVLEAVVTLLAICALVQTGRVALAHFVGLIERLRLA